ncbi:MAG TPA: glycosyltransferase family protein [Bacteriovoracaceae bacterium]|nr:glycosyltransferase family protein [Bacteriovoracaceae bacterium]
MSFKAGIITQARIGSTRLPGKVLKKINSSSLLDYHIRGLKKSGLPVVVATSDLEVDKAIVDFCEHIGVDYFRGSESDVLSRFYHTALKYKFDIVIRVTSDCPLVDGALIKSGLEQSGILQKKNLYVSNALKRTYPRGYDFEIFSFDMLKDAYENAKEPHEREHVTPYIYKKAVANNRNFDVLAKEDFSSFRLTVDTQEDFNLIEILIRDFHADSLSLEGVLEVLGRNPGLKEINADIVQKPLI